MTPEVRRRIYEPFFTTKDGAGTGLGLWVTSQIVDRLHGDLRVWSSRMENKSGTAFSLFLPFEEPEMLALPGKEQLDDQPLVRDRLQA